jgi:hypothetical protein
MDRRSFLTGTARVAVPALLLLTPASAWARGFPGGSREALGPLFTHRPGPRRLRARKGSASWIHHWNEIAVDASGLDHTQPAPGDPRIFGEALGPGRSSLAIALVHIGMFEAVNAIAGGRSTSYCDIEPAGGGVSMKEYAEAIYLGIHWSFDKTQGIAQGRRVADYVFDHAFTPRDPTAGGR